MSISPIASSGMQVAVLRQQVAASNMARQPVDGSPRQAVAASTQANGGVAASVVDASSDPSAPATDLVEGLSARNDFQANATALRRSDEMLGSLLDVLS
ncbi:flagellar basal body rod protein FlgC [Xanthomonas hortorum]|uniref:Flagellar basal-body/hook protein C-terminal domain-containing protein n=1 Tax=Xanthomonas hortorum pv. gardneri TaxID=2754056 RepID=A0A6V7DPF2_9XANT|nr:hypothetical protein [Xanthomonas hortorum]MCC4624326.1 hypothetical protein [Xanthomonas campestris pv. nigromaculans]APP80364.1 hypothetical protein BJD10_12170 [Xanthomonas hortorum pv. gardneri]EGD17837.1 hypothetical protein XGA_3583 [Xanthomonas hortorum ATCC 19865]KLA92322.1 hypothetical protein SM19410_21220 [Xanthomonas hortorum pv. gardneri]KLA99108.1 hypothetical protein SM18210_16785 [Xanthomonas hortorum pv. gardneri]